MLSTVTVTVTREYFKMTQLSSTLVIIHCRLRLALEIGDGGGSELGIDGK